MGKQLFCCFSFFSFFQKTIGNLLVWITPPPLTLSKVCVCSQTCMHPWDKLKHVSTSLRPYAIQMGVS